MATWKGEAWLGTASGRQTVTVQSNTFRGAKEQIEQIYGTSDVHNLREVGRSESSSSDTDFGGIALLCLGLFVLWLIIEYWWIIVPLTVIGGILYYLGSRDD
jgi:hypothetical protein